MSEKYFENGKIARKYEKILKVAGIVVKFNRMDGKYGNFLKET